MNIITTYIVRLVAVGMSSFHVYTAYFGTFYPYIQRSFPVMLALILTFLTVRASTMAATLHQHALFRRLARFRAAVLGWLWLASDLVDLERPAFGGKGFASSDATIFHGIADVVWHHFLPFLRRTSALHFAAAHGPVETARLGAGKILGDLSEFVAFAIGETLGA